MVCYSLHDVEDVSKGLDPELKENQTKGPPRPIPLYHICKFSMKWMGWMDMVLNLWNKFVE